MRALALLLLLAAPATKRPPTGDRQRPAPKADLIRSVELKALFTGELGTVSSREVVYVDLTGDGVEEAIVPIDSKGSAADVAIAVFGYDDAGVLRPMLLHRGQHLALRLVAGNLVITEPLYGPGEPNCCPSGSVAIGYRWDGQALVPSTKQTVAPKSSK
jgi:hypothetical protein